MKVAVGENVEARICDYLHEKGIKKISVSKAAGISRNRFSKMMNQHTKMSAEEFERICLVLEVSPLKFIKDFSKTE